MLGHDREEEERWRKGQVGAGAREKAKKVGEGCILCLRRVWGRFTPLRLLAGQGGVTSVSVRILDRYILREWAKVFTLCLASFSGLLLISEAYNWIPEFINWGSSTGSVLAYLGCSVVIRVSMIVPISLLVSTVFVLSAMNRNQELAAARAAGIGMGRITAPLWWMAGVLAGLLILLNAIWVPDALEVQSRILEREQFAALHAKGSAVVPTAQADYVSFQNAKAHRFWLMTRLGLNAGQAFEISVDTFDKQGRRLRSVKADFADFKKVNGRYQWTFREGRDLKFNPVDGTLISQPRFKELVLAEYDEDPEVMLLARQDPEVLSFREVARYVDQAGAAAAGRNAAYAMRYHTILAAPAICFVVVAVAIPFSVIGGRVSPMVGVAKTFGLFLAFYFASSVCNALGVSGTLPPVMAAWLPTAVTALWAIPKLKSVN